ncbi:hypothetical protein ACIQF6_25065 [Kitasatospora sp. NPDC092948]|uniref:hypothetical protein n=1 Tax=Kitasatospora sp. NPDC092948 TaxID=3364088 RepID=UPI0037FFFB67
MDAHTADPPGPAAVRRRLTATVHVDPSGRVLLYRRTGSAPTHPGHYDLLTGAARQRLHPTGQLASGLLVVRRLLTDRPPAPDPGDVDWYGFVRPAELFAGRYCPLVPGGLDVLRRLFAG